MNPYYKDYADFLAEHFSGKVQKISIDAGGTCPNRDGTFGTGGCAYCNNQAFSPMFDKRVLPVADQLARGKAFFSHKYPYMHYLAYFQSYTATHGSHAHILEMFRQALDDPEVLGLIIGTRPDCIPDSLLDSIAALGNASRKKIFIELGAETSHDSTLERINRCCTWATTEDAVRRIATRGIPVGLHLILGLPGEDEAMIMTTIDRLNALPVATVKFHQLQILHGTPMAQNPPADILQFTPESYAALCARIIRRLRPDIAIERFVAQAPANLLISPRWGLKNYQFTNLLQNHLKNQNLEK
ncbi:MAG: TIGR01212 family radical SAM protein [Bacteroidales bacterium]|nr:TIGR01212 family radical SAM protein [Bacteroidales bacterium]